MKTFKVTRVYADENGESHFENIDYSLSDARSVGFRSVNVKVKEMVFRKGIPVNEDSQAAGPQQFAYLLDQGVEIENLFGEKRLFPPGEILLVENFDGKASYSSDLRIPKRKSLFIILED